MRPLLVAVVALLVGPGAAHAATVGYESQTLAFVDRGSEANDVTVQFDASIARWIVHDAGAPLTAVAGCEQNGPNEARCIAFGVAFLGEGNDHFEVAAGSPSGWDVRGEAGDDELIGTEGPDRLDGGPGADELEGLGGDDTLLGGTGSDVLNGGSGTDLVDYSKENTVTVNLATGHGGPVGDDDTLTGVETIDGTSGDDHLTGDDGPNLLTGEAGRDTIIGGGGDDRIDGGGTFVYAGDDADVLDGGPGDDWVRGGPGNGDAVLGGAGNDRVFGDEDSGDDVDGGTGDDFADGGDGTGDRVHGGDDDDIVSGGTRSDDDVERGGRTDGPDTIDGGPGADTVSYAGRGARDGAVPLPLDIDLRRTGIGQGQVGEGDTITDVENVTGGLADDTIVGTDGANVLAGGEGRDTLQGLGGDDALDAGADQVADSLDCGAGMDRTLNTTAVDVLTGCEPSGPDDPGPPEPTPIPTAAPTPAPPPVAEGRVFKAPRTPTVTLRSPARRTVGRDGRVALRLRAATSDLRATLTLKHGKATVARRTAMLRAGKTVTVRLRLSASARRTLRAGRKLRVTLRISAAGARTTKTTLSLARR